ncbi:MAG TPA: hypothetical protein VHU23_11375 [Rhizomicrobium sp.]|jgi:hypothetical protein|nr:hypothetical protein [Rhizomicrobium sp.]
MTSLLRSLFIDITKAGRRFVEERSVNGKSVRMTALDAEYPSFPVIVDQIIVAVEIGFIGKPVKGAARGVHGRYRQILIVEALDNDAQPAFGRNAAPGQFVR